MKGVTSIQFSLYSANSQHIVSRHFAKSFQSNHTDFKFNSNKKILYSSQKEIKCCCSSYYEGFFQRAVVDADGCGQEGSPVAVCLTADLKKPLTEDTVVVRQSHEEDPQGSP
ncbi:hypothetical protein AMECASPLE_015422 [Ameca splendens]|uniref:Uncharacterized protein n=1 Tax=Ameca splendens TaxID=208324 RepID=A0ABV0Y222_9TELE